MGYYKGIFDDNQGVDEGIDERVDEEVGEGVGVIMKDPN